MPKQEPAFRPVARRAVEATQSRLLARSPGDLLRLGDWIAERAGTGVALGYIERLETYCMGFEFAGERGHLRNDIRPGLRIVGFERRVAIAFTVSSAEVTILGLYYGGREIALHRLKEG